MVIQPFKDYKHVIHPSGAVAYTSPEMRLTQIRAALHNKSVSYRDLVDLANLVDYIEDGDIELLELAGVPEEIK